ncbi:unnamed protein product [Menidia menidia]|uniref:(Atlantic silverside) hypothetical protein n=1 Tax=Menidia menidia TaxID=238744 RepID=A0A8S4BDC5_9TELE|nr:unnamed protein product [Menidia menidia]
MAPPPSQIPCEVWTHVFGYLSVEDKFNVRACCKRFKKLVDHWSLWRGWTVVLSFKNGAYNGRFWTTLRRRKVSGVVMKSAKAKDWSHLAQNLPALTALTAERGSPGPLKDFLKDFPQLRRLAVRGGALLFHTSSVPRPERLTHLSICSGTFSAPAKYLLAFALAQFTSLTSLVCHDLGVSGVPFWMMQTFLSCLPELKHLSLSMNLPLRRPGGVLPVCGTPPGLSSLELINYSHNSLPEETMRLIPRLKRLAVFYKQSHEEMQDGGLPAALHLKTWLSDLPRLSHLVAVRGPPLQTYATSIPATVTSLTLCVSRLSSQDMAAVAARVPRLLRLHIDPWPSHLGARTAEIPHLFPKLKMLKLRCEHVAENDFLHLHRLQDLEHLEVLDNQERLPDLAVKFRALTQRRLQVVTRPGQRDALSCSCVSQVYGMM